ncbi:MAG: uracil phosphoribosyltransferase [Puniceicoccales bacterium]|jgi:uracil phosphoribosyltransferase|nr:uracil phosphoribosyltransferase [Puniceicoccales bacterium]
MALHIVTNPIIQNALTILRQENSPLLQFRQACHQITFGLILEASNRFSTKEINIKTPLAICQAQQIENPIAFIPILRAGLAMLNCAITLSPTAKIGYLGLQRNEKSGQISSYYENLPNINGTNVLILDPMVATGRSACKAMEIILQNSPKTISLCSIIVSQMGLKFISEKFDNVHIYSAAIDDNINAQKYIIPGLGDFGDRFNATTI